MSLGQSRSIILGVCLLVPSFIRISNPPHRIFDIKCLYQLINCDILSKKMFKNNWKETRKQARGSVEHFSKILDFIRSFEFEDRCFDGASFTRIERVLRPRANNPPLLRSSILSSAHPRHVQHSSNTHTPTRAHGVFDFHLQHPTMTRSRSHRWWKFYRHWVWTTFGWSIVRCMCKRFN